MILHQNYQKNSWSRIKLFGRVILLSKILQHASTIRKNRISIHKEQTKPLRQNCSVSRNTDKIYKIFEISFWTVQNGHTQK